MSIIPLKTRSFINTFFFIPDWKTLFIRSPVRPPDITCITLAQFNMSKIQSDVLSKCHPKHS